MATDLETRPASSKAETQVRRKFADLGAQIQRVAVLTHVLILALAVMVYAVSFGVFEWIVGNSTADAVASIRWIAYGMFLFLMLVLAIRTVACFFRRVNPYFVAHQLEQTLPDSKNALINWLDLNEEELPSAFRKNLSATAVEQIDQGDAAYLVKSTKNWVLSGIMGVACLGLLVLFVLGPADFLASMRRAFLPFYAPAPVARVHITLVQPEGGNVEVNPTLSVAFVAKIEGRVPTGNHPYAPKLQIRYQASEDFQPLPLAELGAGQWGITLDPAQLRTGLTYKLTAGDAATDEHAVLVRAGAHVAKFEVTYRHRPYRKAPNTEMRFPNAQSAKPFLRGPRGSDVEMTLSTSRPVKSATVEFIANKVKKHVPIELRPSDPRMLTCKFTLEQAGQFRVLYEATDGEKNIDRELYNIDVIDDPLPSVQMTRPGKDMELPYNSSLVLEGNASAGFGVRALALQLRVVDDPVKLAPLPYRRGNWSPDSLPGSVEYLEFLALDKLVDDKGAIYLPRSDSTIEYWLEAADGSDYPSPQGAIGKSAVYKLKLLPTPVDPKQEQIRRKQALDQKNKHEKRQDDEQKQKQKQKQVGKDKNSNGGNGGGGAGAQQQHDQTRSEHDKNKQQLEQAMQNPGGQGDAKGAEPQNAAPKPGPQGGGDAQDPAAKPNPMTPPGDTGNAKEGGGQPGESRAGGDPKLKSGDNPPPQGASKGIEQQGPTPGQKAGETSKSEGPPNLQAKGGGGGMDDAGASKGEPSKQPGQARDEGPKQNSKNPDWDRMAKNIEKLPGDGPESEAAAGELADIGKKADDPRKSEIAKEALAQNGRDPNNGKKVKNTFGSGGTSKGVYDQIKAAAANREFAARIGQMQLDDWKKRVTPELLKKAGLTEADWERYVKSTQAYDAAVRELNAQLLRKGMRELTTPRATSDSKLNTVETTGRGSTIPVGNAVSPPELREAQRKFSNPP